MHDEEPAGANDPATHPVQVVAPAGAADPASHDWQLMEENPPTENLPPMYSKSNSTRVNNNKKIDL